MQRITLVLLFAAAIAAGCGSSTSPTDPSTQGTNLTGTWSGNVSVQGSTGRMVWTLSQNDSTNVSGPVLIGNPNGTVLVNGFLTGTLSGSILTYTITVGAGGIPLSPACVGQLGGTMNAAVGATSTLAGDYALRSSTCPAPIPNGNVTLTKQ